MEPVTSVIDKLKGFAKSTQDFALDVLHLPHSSNRRNPIEILKRLQREAFSDIMKLRDRQDKVERLLTFYKTSKGSPFQEASTHVRGELDVHGALLMLDSGDAQSCDAIERAGVRTGIDSRFTFETTIREKDTLVAEFVASEKGRDTDVFGSPLSLAKVLYAANVSNWFSAVAIPVGARCRDVRVATNFSHQENGHTEYSASGPPLLNQHNGSAVGIMVKKNDVVASLAQFVSDLGMKPRVSHCFSTFGQLVCQLSSSTKLSLLGIHKFAGLSSHKLSLGAMAIPVRRRKPSETSVEEDDSSSMAWKTDDVLAGSVALMLESQLDEDSRIGGWIEVKQSNPRYVQWAVSMSDTPEDDFGWGLSIGGIVQGPRSWDHFQVETYLKFNLGKRFRVQPAFLYVTDGSTQFPALMLRSSCTF